MEEPDLGRYEILKGNERRQAVLKGIQTTRDQIVGIQGGAGTVKTTALEIVKEIAEEHGFEVRGLVSCPGHRISNDSSAWIGIGPTEALGDFGVGVNLLADLAGEVSDRSEDARASRSRWISRTRVPPVQPGRVSRHEVEA